jgi:hypothetical protein
VGSVGGSSYLTEIRINRLHRFRLKRSFISNPSTKNPPDSGARAQGRSRSFGRSEQARGGGT